MKMNNFFCNNMQAKGSLCNSFTCCHFLKVANPYAHFSLTHTAEKEWQIISKVNFSDILPKKLLAFGMKTKSFPTEHLWIFFLLAKG